MVSKRNILSLTLSCAALRMLVNMYCQIATVGPDRIQEESLKAENLGLTVETFMRIKSQKKWDELLALYCFYLDCCRYQKTQQVWATNEFAAKGIGWNLSKLKRVRRRLREMGLIEPVVYKRDGKVEHHFVRVRYAQSPVNSQKVSFPPGGENHPLENQPTNALGRNGNASEFKKKCLKKKAQSFLEKDRGCFSEDEERFIRIYNSTLPQWDSSFRVVDKLSEELQKVIDTMQDRDDAWLLALFRNEYHTRHRHSRRTLVAILWSEY